MWSAAASQPIYLLTVPLSIDAALNGAGLFVSGRSSCCAWLPAHASPTPVMRTDPDFAPARVAQHFRGESAHQRKAFGRGRYLSIFRTR